MSAFEPEFAKLKTFRELIAKASESVSAELGVRLHMVNAIISCPVDVLQLFAEFDADLLESILKDKAAMMEQRTPQTMREKESQWEAGERMAFRAGN